MGATSSSSEIEKKNKVLEERLSEEKSWKNIISALGITVIGFLFYIIKSCDSDLILHGLRHKEQEEKIRQLKAEREDYMKSLEEFRRNVTLVLVIIIIGFIMLYALIRSLQDKVKGFGAELSQNRLFGHVGLCEILGYEENIESISDIEIGEHITFNRGIYSHHAVVTKVHQETKSYEVIHFTSDKMSGLNKGCIRKEEMKFKIGILSKVRYGKGRLNRVITVHLANALLKLKDDEEIAYHLLANNCEHLVTWCVTGKARSRQIENICGQQRMMNTILKETDAL